ncbi:MAG: hypothetical protein RL021_1360 [Bacteroidota bacterium]|jgi:choice-of-anchor B domain-containing protein
MNRSSIIIFLLLALPLGIRAQKNMTQLSVYTFPFQNLSGCWHYTDTAGNEYALIGAQNGIAFLDITQPSNPQFLFQLPGNSSNWHEVKVEGTYAYAVSEGVDTAGILNGVQIMDLRYLPDSVPYKFWQGDANMPAPLVKGHTVTVDNGYLYVNGHNISQLGQGVLICSLADPWNPVYLGAITNHYSHDSYVRGNRLYSSEILAGQFAVYDITNRASPLLLATQSTPGLFNHNTWLSDNGQVIFTTDERGNQPVAAYDISNLSNISLLDEFKNVNLTQYEVHNVRVFNDYLINPSYGSQLTIADASRPDNIVEIANFPTGNFLCWDADPYLASGAILATDMYFQKVYLFQPNYVRACYLEGTVTDSVTGLPVSNAAVSIVNSPVVKYSNTIGDYRTGIVDTGHYDVIFARQGYTTKLIPGVSLQTGQVTALNVQLSPDNIGVDETDFDRILHVYPQPATDRLIMAGHETANVTIQLCDLNGKEVLRTELQLQPGRQQAIDISGIPNGMYVMQCIREGVMAARRIAVIR